MENKEIPTLEQKQTFWAEQLPNFEAKYWLPSHFEFLVFDMEQGNYVIKDDLDPSFEDDATEIWHRVNTGWAMWKKAINFSKAQAIPEGFVLVDKKHTEDWYLDDQEGMWYEQDGIDDSLCDLDPGQVQAVEHKEYLITESNTVYASKVWDESNDQVGFWEFFKTKEEAEKVAGHCKAMIEAQEQEHD
ncbi:hypothetical protein QR665_09440 [Acinetobacter gerneri]|uniref:hypothetical protein n=1 Tax=Acinetobacter gerneri TaxID=202952 RepID=UPI002935D713|nr:hypothetical protein [Acinetobacter gerneri]MDV2439692.1 hypothetical protein [Acinetobacter gerneri]